MTIDFRGQRPPQLVVAKGNNIFEVTETHIRGRRPPYFLVAGATRLSKSHVPTKIGTMVTILLVYVYIIYILVMSKLAV